MQKASQRLLYGTMIGILAVFLIAAAVRATNVSQIVLAQIWDQTNKATVSTAGALKIDGSAVTQPAAVVSPLPAGTNVIGQVSVSGTPAIAGTVAVSAIASPLPSGTNVIGQVSVSGTPTVAGTVAVSSLASPLPGGTNTIGSVTLASPVPAGTNVIGSVVVASPLPSGTNTIGGVTLPSPLPAGTNTIGGVTLPSPLPAGTNAIGHVTVDGTPTVSASISGTPTVSISGTPTVAGTVTVTQATASSLNALTTAIPATSGGLIIYSNTALTNSVVAVKTTAGQLYSIHFDNTMNTAKSYVQVFNLATGSVTLGVTAPTQTFVAPGSGGYDFLWNDIGVAFGTAISIAATTTATGSTAPSTALIVNMEYK